MTTRLAKCPACRGRLNEIKEHNSVSRFCDVYICLRCGIKEALDGFFWEFDAARLKLTETKRQSEF